MEKELGRFSKWSKLMWFYLKYQLLTKSLILIAISPLSSTVMRALIKATGRTSISSGDFLGFALSLKGLGASVLGVVMVLVLLGLDINAFILASAIIHKNEGKITARQLLWEGIKSLKYFISPMGLVVIIYIAIVIPLVGVGITISPMEGFQIPNFIKDVIFNNAKYMGIYFVAIGILAYISIRYIFFLHYTLLRRDKIFDALRNSAKLIKENWKHFIFHFFVKSIGIVMLVAIFIIFITFIFAFAGAYFTPTLDSERIVLILGMVTTFEITILLSIMSVPTFSHRLTNLFFLYNEKDGEVFETKLDVKTIGDSFYGDKISGNKKMGIVFVIILILVINGATAWFYGTNFDEIFRNYKNIDIVAHRGGGDLAAENTIKSLERAIEEGAKWSEIDVQRTLDGEYIINHDSTFKRVAGDSRSSKEMTLEEVKELRVKDLFDESRPAQEVATLEEFMDAAKGKIGLYIELKGSTADEKMVDDVVKMIKDKNMLDETAILSLNYDLIKYAEEKYPEITTGFLYFFVFGDVSKLKADILIMEEREADVWKVEEIHEAGKKAVVWTVNTEDSINRFVGSKVDGIITDYVLLVKDGMKNREEKTDFELVAEYFAG